MLRYNFYDKKQGDNDQDIYLLITKGGELRADEKEICNEIFERTYQQMQETAHPGLNPGKYAAFKKLSLRAIELAWFLSANISIEVTKGGAGTLQLESSMFILTSGENQDYMQTIAELFMTADNIFCFVPNNGLPKIEFNFALCDTAEL